MGDNTGIEWTDATWNRIVGCSVTSPGCTHCYAMRQAMRIERMQPGSHYAGLTQPSKAGPVWTGKLALAPEHILTAPLRWKRPRKIFVNPMSDLFHEDVPDAWIDEMFAVMALSPQHTFQVLTKRSARMRSYMTSPGTAGRIARVLIDNCVLRRTWNVKLERLPTRTIGDIDLPDDIDIAMPLPNVWLGVSCEDQTRADERVPDLLATPAAVRFLSIEPMLGPVNIADAMTTDAARRVLFAQLENGQIDKRGSLHWIIVGGESGPGTRPMHPDWARDIRDQCAAAGVAFHFKQWGEWRPPLDDETFDTSKGRAQRTPAFIMTKEGTVHCFFPSNRRGCSPVVCVGKHRAGRELDGVTHDAWPAAEEPRQ